MGGLDVTRRVGSMARAGRLAALHDARLLRTSARTLWRSREATNFTYDLTALNRDHLAWYCAVASDRPVDEIRAYFRELEEDDELRRHIRTRTERGPQRSVSDGDARFGRRLGWYALARATHPSMIVETGTDKGLGSIVFAAALLRNGTGRVTTVDVDAGKGWLVGGRWADVVDARIGDSLAVIPSLAGPVDLFLHDSLHTEGHERAELDAVRPLLSPRSLVLSDNAHVTPVLADWAQERGRRFLFFAEQPHDHWYPGAGIGAALPPERRLGTR